MLTTKKATKSRPSCAQAMRSVPGTSMGIFAAVQSSITHRIIANAAFLRAPHGWHANEEAASSEQCACGS
eukprot:2663334-Pleurochrysis_carterae.AAC.1